MKLSDSFLTALKGLRTNKVRSALTILGVVIGVSAIIAVMAIGQGAESLIIDQISSLGSNNIFIEPGPWSEKMERGTMMQSIMEEFEIKTLKYEDALAIEKLSSVERTAPFVMGVERIIYENESRKTTFLGTTPQAQEIFDVDCIFGRHINDQDVKSMARVAVLGYQVWEDLFGGENPVGRIIRIKKTNFRIVGVIGERGPQAFMDLDQSVYLPFVTAQKLLLGQDFIRLIVVQAQSEDLIEQAIYDIRLLLRERHGIHNPEGDPGKDDFKVMSQQQTAEILGNITGIFTILLSAIAAISLLVGGIGIMNIMLVSVTERTKEVGLRKAVGARKKDILNQFLLEAVFLTLVGGILGVVLGSLFSWAASLAFAYFLNSSWGFLLPVGAIILGVGVSVFVGLVFGIYPAYKASQLSPIDALRYE